MEIEKIVAMPFKSKDWWKKLGSIMLVRLIASIIMGFVLVIFYILSIPAVALIPVDFFDAYFLIFLSVILIFSSFFWLIRFYENAYINKISLNILNKREDILSQHKNWVSTIKFYIKLCVAQLIASFPIWLMFIIYTITLLLLIVLSSNSEFVNEATKFITIFSMVIIFCILLAFSFVYKLFFLMPARYRFFKTYKISSVLEIEKILSIGKKTWKIAIKYILQNYLLALIASIILYPIYLVISLIPFGGMVATVISYTPILVYSGILYGNYFTEIEKAI